MTTSAGAGTLLDALVRLRDALAAAQLPLDTVAAADARLLRRRFVDQLDDYVLPRLRTLDAPLLAVVGGSTGAGKSTLVNSLVGEAVTRPGVLRPTTRAPLLVHHPADERWFGRDRVLPGLTRVAGGGDRPDTLGLAASSAVPEGLALLDAPDIDSIVADNRRLARQLLDAADLWLFVTSAARYADAVPWDLLHEAAQRGIALAVVLDRVPPEAAGEVRADLAQHLAANGLGWAPLFVVEETPAAGELLPAAAVAPLRDWLHGLAADADARDAVVRQTLTGALGAVADGGAAVADAVAATNDAVGELREAATLTHVEAARSVDEALRDGQVLRGEVLVRWQEFVGTGELLRALESRLGRLRDRVTAAVTGRPAAAQELTAALESGLEALLTATAAAAAERTADAWRARPGGAALLDAHPGLGRVSPDFAARVHDVVRDWQHGVLDLVREKARGKRTVARVLSYGVNGAALVVMVAVFAHTGGLTGGEVAVAGGASAVGQKLLEALLGDQAVRDLAAQARADLRTRVDLLLGEERQRFDDALPAVDPLAADRLRDAVAAVRQESW